MSRPRTFEAQTGSHNENAQERARMWIVTLTVLVAAVVASALLGLRSGKHPGKGHCGPMCQLESQQTDPAARLQSPADDAVQHSKAGRTAH